LWQDSQKQNDIRMRDGFEAGTENGTERDIKG